MVGSSVLPLPGLFRAKAMRRRPRTLSGAWAIVRAGALAWPALAALGAVAVVAPAAGAAALAPASAWALRLASWVSSISAMVLVLVVSMVARLFGGLSRAEAPGDGLDGVRVQ